jgi:HEAT repeat protein
VANERKKSIFLHPISFRVAAAVALLIIGGGLGFWITAYQRQQAVLESMRKEMEATKMIMMAMLHNHQSASQRLQGANVAYEMKSADDDIVKALVKAMNEDPNTNVRLAALDALGKFHQQEHVRKALVASLVKQNDPVVQIALIRLMVNMKEKEVIGELQRITNDEEALPAVKDEAHVGLLRLS